MNYMISGNFIGASKPEEITDEIILPPNEELAKSLISPKMEPYLVTIRVHGNEHTVKIVTMTTGELNEHDSLSIFGYVQNDETKKWANPCYKTNYNWFTIAQRKS